jgi:DHA1 family multidrug resistance protein-like MFS transporter
MVAWRKTFYSMCAAQFISMAGFAFVMPFLPFYIVQDLGVPKNQSVQWASILMSAPGLPMAIFALIWGHLADRYGRKLMVLRAMYAGGVIVTLMGLVQNVHELLILRLIQGTLTGTVAAGMALVASETPTERSAYVLGVMQASVIAGASFGPLMGGHAAVLLGFRPTFYIAGVMILAGALIVQFGVKETFTPPTSAEKVKTGTYRDLFSIGGYLTLILVLFLINFGTIAPAPVFPYFVQELSGKPYDQAAAVAGQIMFVVGFADMASAWFLGHLADQWGHKRMLVLCTLMAGIFSLPYYFVKSIPQLYLLRMIFGLAAGGVMPSLYAIIRRITPERDMGKAFGITAFIANAAFCFGPLAGGYISLLTGKPDKPYYVAPFLLCGVALILISWLAAWRVKSATHNELPTMSELTPEP